MKEYQDSPRDFAIYLVDVGLVDWEYLGTLALRHMSQDEVRDMLDANELSPRFLNQDIEAVGILEAGIKMPTS